MGRVKELWMDQQEEKFNRRVEALIALGNDPLDAERTVAEQMEYEEDVRNGGPDPS